MINTIKDFIEFRKAKKQRIMRCKRFVVMQAMIKFFEDLQISRGGLDWPPFICAHREMQNYKTDKQINKLYRKFEMAGLVWIY